VRRPSAALLAAVLAVLLFPGVAGAAGNVLVLDGHGHVQARHDRFLPPPDPAPMRAAGARGSARAAPSGPTVPAALDTLLAAGAIDQVHRDAWAQAYDDAKRTLTKLHGVRRRQLDAVLSNTRALAAGGQLTAQRAPAVFLTLKRNRAWWAASPLLRYGQRVMFTGSQLVWQYYPGQGIQLQALANFGKLNGLWQGRIYDDRLSQLLDELLALGVDRAGGTAWEYYFTFDGGRPPWVSSLAQGTALQALARAAIRLGRQDEVWPVANAGLAIFKTAPPAGVRVPSGTGSGTHYLQYSYDRHLYILNGFVQSLNGLSDYAKLANDPEGQALFQDGLTAARAEVPEFDTGAWSLYSRGDSTHESDLSYHKLLRDFMRGLCDRTQDPVFCSAREHYDTYLVTKPQLQLLTTRVRGGTTGALKFRLSKISRIGVRVTRADGTAVLVRQAGVLGYGRRAIAWSVPRRKGIYTVALTAVDLAGNAQSISGPVEVLKPKQKRKR
jgi:D-glucuronyl C5-epimerase C-terminus